MARDPRGHEDAREYLMNLADLDRRYRRAIVAGDQRAALRHSIAELAADSHFGVAWIAQPEDDGTQAIRVTAGTRTDLLHNLIIAPGSGLTGKVFRLGQIEWVDEYFGARSITHDFDRHIEAEGVAKLIAVPILRERQVIGTLVAGSRTGGSFGDRSIEHVVAMANSAALAGAVAERTRQAAEIAAHEERRRVALELHDSVGAMLYAVTAGVRRLSDDMSGTADDDVLQKLTDLQTQAAEATRLLRESLRTLHASPSELALSVALQADCQSFEQRSGITTHVMTLGELPALSAERMRLVSTAVREALLNVEKHAQATSVAVTISQSCNELVIAVTDDGVGLAGSDPDTSPGIGLVSLSEALGRAGGRLELRSPPEGGTIWRARLPV
ncbi:MAG TPA: GAF domain-containing protein [Pseudonocardia sp.]|jgi:signal transduction histidine kinase|nr:GAF domain-containing protein [Pseudonocardia sp.]